MARPKTDKKTAKTTKAKKGDASPAKNSKKPKAPKAAAPETAKVPEPVSPPPVTVAPPDVNAFFDDPTLSMSGYEAHEALKHVLNSTPKPDDTPPLASVLLDGDKLIATDDHTHHTAFLSHPISEGPIKITRASAEALRAMLDGELKSAQQLDAAPEARQGEQRPRLERKRLVLRARRPVQLLQELFILAAEALAQPV
jgi:hypothetical protein